MHDSFDYRQYMHMTAVIIDIICMRIDYICSSFFSTICYVHLFFSQADGDNQSLIVDTIQVSAHRRRSKHQSTLEYRYFKKTETGNRETDNLDYRRDEKIKDQSRKKRRDETRRGSETKSMCEKGGEREAVREKMRKGRGRPETLKEQ